jgi:hypothetical protein
MDGGVDEAGRRRVSSRRGKRGAYDYSSIRDITSVKYSSPTLALPSRS